MKILLVEDDAMIGDNIQIALKAVGIAVDWAKDGVDAQTALDGQLYDAVVLDLGLPLKSGLAVLQELRATGNHVPVLIVTASDTVSERVLGLNEGADDYLTKPFELEELIARLHALVRRAQGRIESIYQYGDIIINSTTRQVSVAGRSVILSLREWIILDALIARPGAILSRSHLEERLYGLTGDIESNAVEVYIHGLRKKLNPQLIVNVRSVGYMVKNP